MNISRSGMLMESRSKLVPDSSTEFSLCGQGSNLFVRARVVRSEVAAVDVRGVKYLAAAVFDGTIDLLPAGPQRSLDVAAAPSALEDLLVRVTGELDRGRETEAIRTGFEEEVCRLVSARDVKIRDVPVAPTGANESIYFRVPDGNGSGAILQVMFDPHHEPTAEEFRLLKAAASAAAVILKYGGHSPQPQNCW